MNFQVTEIEFDFTTCPYCGEVESSEHNTICDGFVELRQAKHFMVGEIWEASDKNDLIDELFAAYGYPIKDIDYRIISND
jgi:hypothetical protein